MLDQKEPKRAKHSENELIVTSKEIDRILNIKA